MFFLGILGETPSEDGFRQLTFDEIALGVLTIPSVATLEVKVDKQTHLISPAELVGILALGSTGKQEIRRFLSKWKAQIAAPVPEIYEVSELNFETPVSIARWTSEQLARRLRHVASGNHALRRQLSVLRQDYEVLARSAKSMETYLVDIGAVQFNSVLTAPFGRAYVEVRLDDRPLTQLIAAAPFGVAGFDLYFDSENSDPGALISIVLRGRETDRTYGEWNVAIGERDGGWTSFSLSRGIDVEADTLEFVIALRAGKAAKIGLGPPHPNPSACAQIGGAAVEALGAKRPLAMKIWRGAPTVPAPVLKDAIAPLGAAASQVRLPPRAFASAVAYSSAGRATLTHDDSTRVLADGAVSIQPTPEGDTYLLLENVLPPNTISAHATFSVVSTASNGVEVALAFAPAVPKESELRGLIADLDWTTIEYGRPECVAASKASGSTERSLLIATRVSNPDQIWFAAIQLVALEFRIDGSETLVTRPKTVVHDGVRG